MSNNQVSDSGKTELLTENNFWTNSVFVDYVIDAARRANFPCVGDRSPNQPTIIVQPNVVKSLISQIESLLLPELNSSEKDSLDELINSLMEKNRLSRTNVLFVTIARYLAWENVFLTGNQIVLSNQFKISPVIIC
jgi:hypothetical protein